MKSMTHISQPAILAALLAVASLPSSAELPTDYGAGPTTAVLPSPPGRHWVWVNDFVFAHMADGQAHLVDADSGRYLGMLSTGYSFTRIVIPRDRKLVYSPESYFSRGTRGTRTDVVTVYDAATLNVLDEIAIPARRSSNMPMMGDAELTDDDRFLLVYNFTGSSSVSVVDTTTRKFIGEVEIPGCALVYPLGPRTFFTLCGDGNAELVVLDDAGAVLKQSRTKRLFDVDHDPVTEKPVRVGDTWFFVSFDGQVIPVRFADGTLVAGQGWWLTSAAERKQGWRPGGLQQLAVHAGRHRLYAIMHQGNRDTHKDPGKTVWVYDLESHKRVQRIALQNLASSIQLSRDDKPLLYSVFIDRGALDIYDGLSGLPLRTIKELGSSPALLIVP
jgi:methylamine dehydrogenase heavy chain